MEERLQKILARAGVASRRAAEELIAGGRVRVNGRVAQELGTKADPRRDKVEVDGRRLVAERPAYVVLHKPRLAVSTVHDPEGRPTVAELVKGVGARLYPVGRLDFHTSGTLLLTNDGEFAHGLLHPREGVPKTYVVKVQGVPTDATLARWREGVELDDGLTAPCEVRLIREEAGKGWLEVTLTEGRNQQIRRMGEATGHPVMRLARLSFAGVTSEGLRPGQWRALTADELTDLRTRYGVPRRVRGANEGFGAPPRSPRSRAAGGFGDRRPARRPGAPAFEGDDGGYESQGRPRAGQGASREALGDRRGLKAARGDGGERGTPARRGGPGGRGATPARAVRSFGHEGDAPRGGHSFGREEAAPRAARSFSRDDAAPRGGRSFDREGAAPRAARSFDRERATPRGGRSFDGDDLPRSRSGRDVLRGPSLRGQREGAVEGGRPGRAGGHGGRGGRAAPAEGRSVRDVDEGRSVGARRAGGGDADRRAFGRQGGDRDVAGVAGGRRSAERDGGGSGTAREGGRAGVRAAAGDGRRTAQKSSAAVPSAKGHASKGTKSRAPSRASRPR